MQINAVAAIQPLATQECERITLGLLLSTALPFGRLASPLLSRHAIRQVTVGILYTGSPHRPCMVRAESVHAGQGSLALTGSLITLLHQFSREMPRILGDDLRSLRQADGSRSVEPGGAIIVLRETNDVMYMQYPVEWDEVTWQSLF